MLWNFLLAIFLLNPISNVYSSDNHYFEFAEKKYSAPTKTEKRNLGAVVSAKKFAVIDLRSGFILTQKDGNVQQPIASLTKLMTALIVLQANPDWQKTVEMEEFDETVGASPHIYRGERVKFIDLFKSALISSDNNAIMAMVRSLGFSREEFVKKMNDQSEKLKMYNTRFADPTGLSPDNLSTAMDVTRLLVEAMEKKEIKESVMQEEYFFAIENQKKGRRIFSTDILLQSFLNDSRYGYELIGGKTGYLPEAGYCLATLLEKDGRPIIVVVLDSDSIEDRFQDSKILADWVYESFAWSSHSDAGGL